MDHIIHTQLNELNSCKLGGVSQSPANLFGGVGNVARMCCAWREQRRRVSMNNEVLQKTGRFSPRLHPVFFFTGKNHAIRSGSVENL